MNNEFKVEVTLFVVRGRVCPWLKGKAPRKVTEKKNKTTTENNKEDKRSKTEATQHFRVRWQFDKLECRRALSGEPVLLLPAQITSRNTHTHTKILHQQFNQRRDLTGCSR